MIGLAVSGYVSYQILQKDAREQVVRDARLMMDTAIAIRNYTVQQVRPHLAAKPNEFLAQSVPAFAATETLDRLKEKYPEYSYREATLNPTNIRDKARPWEAELVQVWRDGSEVPEILGERITYTSELQYIARPIKITNPACLACHSTPEAAPAAMLTKYGKSRGFGWNLNEVVGAQMVTVPMKVAIEKANQAFFTFMWSMVAIFAAIFVVLNVMLGSLIIKLITQMAGAAEKISNGDFDVAEFGQRGQDEVSLLGKSFNRMRRSLQKAMEMLQG